MINYLTQIAEHIQFWFSKNNEKFVGDDRNQGSGLWS